MDVVSSIGGLGVLEFIGEEYSSTVGIKSVKRDCTKENVYDEEPIANRSVAHERNIDGMIEPLGAGTVERGIEESRGFIACWITKDCCADTEAVNSERLDVNTFKTVLELDPGRVCSKDWECKERQGDIREKHGPVVWSVQHLKVGPGRVT